MATVVIPHCSNQSFSLCKSSVNVSKLRTGLGSWSCGTATKISVAPTSIPAAWGSIPLRLGTAPPGRVCFCFLLFLHSICVLLGHGGGQVVFRGYSPKRDRSCTANHVTNVSITKLGDHARKRASSTNVASAYFSQP